MAARTVTRSRRLMAGAVVTLLVIALSVFFYLRRTRTLEALPLRRGPIVEAVYGLGTVTARRTFDAKIGVTSAIRSIPKREGDAVKQGDELLILDEGQRIRAPFSGVLTAVNFDEGESVFPQATILTVTDVSDLYVAVTLEQLGALRVRPTQKGVLSFESLRGEKLEGRVRSVYPKNNQFMVQIDLVSLPKGILPGMTADVAIEVARRENALLLPVAALSQGFVTRIRNGSAKKVPVKIGVIDGEWAEVLEGDITEDDSVRSPRK
jgi:macrolide-specific efflux system membrane fusion protein